MRIMRLAAACAIGMVAVTTGHTAENDQRWYVSAMLTGIDAAEDRGADDDLGGFQLAVGKNMGDRWSVEGKAVAARFENGDVQLSRQWGFGVDFIGYFMRSDQFQPYAVAGAGYLVTDKKLGRDDRDGAMAELGVGLKMPSALGFEFRTDFRARRDFTESDAVTDYLWNFGFNFPLSARRVDTRSLPGGEAGAGSGPSYRFVADSDGDGFLDPEDQCPHTAGGEPVNAFGCSPGDDADGDNVPNTTDMCGDTPAGVAVDKFGCRITPPDELSVPTDGE